MRYHDGHASYTQYIHNLNMSPSSKPLLCDVIYVYCKVALLAVENTEDVERSVPIFQDENTGPHICAVFHNYMKEYCTAMGWKWETEAP